MHRIKVIEGPLEGKSFKIQNGVQIGRSQGGIVLNDSAVSDFHAEIKIDSDGTIMLLDKDSKNGIFLGKQKKKQIVLKQDLEFRIGKNTFQVSLQLSPEESWSSFLEKNLKTISDQKGDPLTAFPFTVELHFLSGPQREDIYYLTYGPCVFEKDSKGHLTVNPKTSNDLFRLTSFNQTILFQSEHAEVMFNGKHVKKENLKDDDNIAFGDINIKVLFTE